MNEPLEPHVLDNLEQRAQHLVDAPTRAQHARIPAHMLLSLIHEVRQSRGILNDRPDQMPETHDMDLHIAKQPDGTDLIGKYAPGCPRCEYAYSHLEETGELP